MGSILTDAEGHKASRRKKANNKNSGQKTGDQESEDRKKAEPQPRVPDIGTFVTKKSAVTVRQSSLEPDRTRKTSEKRWQATAVHISIYASGSIQLAGWWKRRV